MKKETVTIQMDAEKLRAVKRYMGKKEQTWIRALRLFAKLYEICPATVQIHYESANEKSPVQLHPKNRKKK